MSGTLRLAWRYLTWHRTRSLILVLCILLTLLLPFAVTMLVDVYGARFRARATATPYVVGAPGSRYDLVLSALYFKGQVRTPSTMAEVERAGRDGLAVVVPLHVGSRAEGHPLVGTSHDYVRLRGLRTAAGRFAQMPGECVLGAKAAADLDKGVGAKVLTDTESVYDFGLAYPIRMRVVGVLAETGTADDRAIFTDLDTVWIMLGFGHGHEAPDQIDADSTSGVKDGTHQLNPKTHLYTEITPENVDSFHMHAEPENLPVTAMIVNPRDGKARTFLKGRYAVSKTGQLIEPVEVVDELLEFVFQLKAFFDANVVLVTAATMLFLALVVLLSVRVRRAEIETLFKIGCARLTVFRMLAFELAIVVLLGAVLAAGLAWFGTQVLLSDFLP
ncbi:MAG: ABC transporter permease [Planctomycetota bacterium]|nr:ABC transporter permease [Planctomycetota bacterium]